MSKNQTPTSFKGLRAAFITLGCKVNQYETQVMRESLERSGYSIVESHNHADVYVINTCTVTGISDRKSRQAIRRAFSINPRAIVVVTGCYLERSPDEIKKISGVVLTIPNSQKHLIGDFLQDLVGNQSNQHADNSDQIFITNFEGQTRALVKIEDGCDSYCTYCIVPYVRGGTIHSRPLDSIVHEVKNLASNGHHEVVLTGIHLGAYGKDIADGTKLHHVIRAIHDINGIERIRLSSIEPMDIPDELIYEMANLPKCAHHFHISLQSGSDKILKLMNRGYTASEFEAVAKRVRDAMPDVGLSTDVMVGFPGETEEDFADTLQLIKRVRFSRLHVFRYSPREGTPAARFPDQVQDSVISRRSKEARTLGNKLAQRFRLQILGQESNILLEDSREGKRKLLAGFTGNYMRVLISDAKDDFVGQMLRVKLMDIEDEFIIGQLV